MTESARQGVVFSCARWLLVVACVVGPIVSCTSGGHEKEYESAVSRLVSDGSLDPQILRIRESLVEDVGIKTVLRVDELVADHIDNIFPHVKYRTDRDRTTAEDRLVEEIFAADADHRAMTFDLMVEKAILLADDSRTGDIARDHGLMYDAFEAALAECARDSGIDDVSLLLHASLDDVVFMFIDRSIASEESYVEERSTEELWKLVELQDPREEVELYGEDGAEFLESIRRHAEQHGQVAASLGLTSDELLDLRQACSRNAATLPTLEPSVRLELMKQLREHYLLAAYSHAAMNPPDSICMQPPCE